MKIVTVKALTRNHKSIAYHTMLQLTMQMRHIYSLDTPGGQVGGRISKCIFARVQELEVYPMQGSHSLQLQMNLID